MKAFAVEIEPDAIGDLLNIEDYLGLRNPKAARELIAVILGALDTIALFPEIGRAARQMRGARYYVVRGYRIYYRAIMRAETVAILRIFDTRQDLGRID